MKNSIDAQRQVIGGILLDESVLSQVLSTGIIPKDFAPTYEIIFNYILEMRDEGEHIDALHLRNWIDLQGNHSGDWTGFPYLCTMMEECVGVANIVSYANHIRNTRIENEIDELKVGINYDNYQTTVDEIRIVYWIPIY
jgi:replicative DNA helicase